MAPERPRRMSRWSCGSLVSARIWTSCGRASAVAARTDSRKTAPMANKTTSNEYLVILIGMVESTFVCRCHLAGARPFRATAVRLQNAGTRRGRGIVRRVTGRRRGQPGRGPFASDEDLNVVWHHGPGAKLVAVTVKEQKRALDQFGNSRASKITGAVMLIKGGFEPASADLFGDPGKNVFPGMRRDRIGQAKFDELGDIGHVVVREEPAFVPPTKAEL